MLRPGCWLGWWVRTIRLPKRLCHLTKACNLRWETGYKEADAILLGSRTKIREQGKGGWALTHTHPANPPSSLPSGPKEGLRHRGPEPKFVAPETWVQMLLLIRLCGLKWATIILRYPVSWPQMSTWSFRMNENLIFLNQADNFKVLTMYQVQFECFINTHPF